jgi:hypothetical protein
LCSQADERTEREWSSEGDSEQLVGADAATSLLVSSSCDGDMLLQVGCSNNVYDRKTNAHVNHSIDNKLVFTSEQPRMTQLLATLVPAMFEAWNKVTSSSESLAKAHVSLYFFLHFSFSG